MQKKLLIHQYHFGDIRELILSNIQSLFNIDDLVNNIPKKQNYYIAAEVTDTLNRKCEICLILVENGVLIHTSFPKQKNVHDRLWVIDPFIGRISYIEITNPDFKTININMFFDRTDENIEIYAWPEDLNFLNTLLITTVNSANKGLLKPVRPNSSAIKLLNI